MYIGFTKKIPKQTTTKKQTEVNSSYQTQHPKTTPCQQDSYRGSAGANEDALHFIIWAVEQPTALKRRLTFVMKFSE